MRAEIPIMPFAGPEPASSSGYLWQHRLQASERRPFPAIRVRCRLRRTVSLGKANQKVLSGPSNYRNRVRQLHRLNSRRDRRPVKALSALSDVVSMIERDGRKHDA